MNTETKMAFLIAGIIWIVFIIIGLIGKPVKLSAVSSIGGGFIAACASIIFRAFTFSAIEIVVILGLLLVIVAVISQDERISKKKRPLRYI